MNMHCYHAKVSCPKSNTPELDVDDLCADRQLRDTCFDGPEPSPNADDIGVQAFTDNNMDADFGEIHFCRKYLQSLGLDEVIISGIRDRNKNMAKYENRGRAFLHEMTHLDWFVNAPATTPYITDVRIVNKSEYGRKMDDSAYGPPRAKILQNYPSSRGGFYTQRNGKVPLALPHGYDLTLM
jgi:hypothetical protein